MVVGREADADSLRRSLRRRGPDGSGCPDRSSNVSGSRGGEVLILEGSGSGESGECKKSDDSVRLHGHGQSDAENKIRPPIGSAMNAYI